MKRVAGGILIVLLGACLAVSAAQRVWHVFAAEQKHTNVTITTTNDDDSSDDCAAHLDMHSHEHRAVVRGEEVQSVPNQALKITAEHNGGISVTTWDKPEFSIKLCKQVGAHDDSQARKILDSTKLNIGGGSVSVSSPESEGEYSLGTLMIVKAPREAQIGLKVINGGISLNDFTGTAEARATNGGVTVKRSSGQLTLEAENGGVSIQDCGGDVKATVENGGLSLVLPEHWEGKGLDAHTENGGLSISIPKNFNTGLEVTSSEYVGIVCRGNVCENGRQTERDGNRIFHLGAGETQIHAAAVNGGIVIQDRGRTHAKADSR
ncbi:MAG TPA: DUF4097 family beta strand repeat-containing protein [Candidatus Angelobacter sp.]|nr:DUF4097 family beta strand repeat-containing protein [Candidatus Angelobacter sp.]